MHTTFYEEIKKSLQHIDLEHKKPVIFGANAAGIDIADCLKETGIELFAVVDNDPVKQGKSYCGVIISKPEMLLAPYNAGYAVLIASRYFFEIKQQLQAWGYREGCEIFRVAAINDEYKFGIIAPEEFDDLKGEVLAGLELYHSILDKYGSDVKIHIATVSSVGDIFLISLFFEGYLRQQKIGNQVLLIPGNAAAQLAEWRGIRCVQAVSKSDVDKLIKLAMLAGFERTNMMLMHTGYIHTRIWSRVLTLIKFTWLDHVREFLLLPPDTQPVSVAPDIDTEYLVGLFGEHGLKRGKTVVLAPYTNAVRQIPIGVWEELAAALKKRGYTVATNVGSDNEKPISGTVALRFALKDAVGVLEYAGHFIAIRSGLCDITASAKCNKIVIYSNEIWDLIEVFDFCSLKKMGLCDDAAELVYDGNDERLKEQVLSCFSFK